MNGNGNGAAPAAHEIAHAAVRAVTGEEIRRGLRPRR